MLCGRARATQRRNTLLGDGSMFGRFARPAGFRCHSNTYASPGEDADEEDEEDEVACAVCGVDTWIEGNCARHPCGRTPQVTLHAYDS